jgi:hypothetical protein
MHVKSLKWHPSSLTSSFRSQPRVRMADKGRMMNSTYWPELAVIVDEVVGI